MSRPVWRVLLFLGIVYGVNGNLTGAFPWLAFMLVAEGMEFAVHTVREWDRQEAAYRGR